VSLAAVLLGFWPSTPAIAIENPALVWSDPAAGTRTRRAPESVFLAFDQTLFSDEELGVTSTIEVFDECGRRVDGKDSALADGFEGGVMVPDSILSVTLARRPAGVYTVEYQAVGLPGESGTTVGRFAFKARYGRLCDGSGAIKPPAEEDGHNNTSPEDDPPTDGGSRDHNEPGGNREGAAGGDLDSNSEDHRTTASSPESDRTAGTGSTYSTSPTPDGAPSSPSSGTGFSGGVDQAGSGSSPFATSAADVDAHNHGSSEHSAHAAQAGAVGPPTVTGDGVPEDISEAPLAAPRIRTVADPKIVSLALAGATLLGLGGGLALRLIEPHLRAR
jgi:methionine-rich copper-binding protein CopC